MLFQLEPDTTLVFSKAQPTRVLKITNAHSGNLAFKVKTTAPKAYLVRPSFGTLRPQETMEVQIALHPPVMDRDENKDRFLVQAVAVNDIELSKEDFAKFTKEERQESRLNVVFDEGDGEKAPAPAAAAAKARDTAAASYSAVGAGAAAPEFGSDLKNKYDELVQYTLTLEKEKKKLQNDLESFRSSAAGGSDAGGDGISKLTLIIAMLVAFLAAYATKYVG